MLFRLGSRLSVFRKGQDTQQTTGTFENVVIKNVKADAAADAQLTPASGILITGVPGHYITNLTLENIEINLDGKGTKENARHEVPEAINQYPEVKTFGPTIPAYGVWARHARGLVLKNIKFNLANNDVRPALICDDCENVIATDWSLTKTEGSESVVRLNDVKGANISNFKVNGATAEAFIRTEGNTANVVSKNNQIKGIKKN